MSTLRKEFDTVFSSSVDIYRRLVESVRAGIYVTDSKGNFVYVNQAFVNILGYQSKDEVMGLNLVIDLYFHPADRTEFLNKLEKMSFVRDYQVQSKRKDGTLVNLSITSNVIYGERNEITGIEGVIHDITDQKRLQQDLFILRSAIEQTADHVMITDKKGVIQYVNPAFEKTTGFTKEEVLGKTPSILKSGKHTGQFYQTLWETILAGKVFHSEVTNKKKNQELYIADQIISPIISDSGEITYFVSIWQDITEKVNLEKRLKIEKEKLEEIVGFDEKASAIRKTEKLIDFVVAKTLKILGAKKCAIMLIDHETGTLCMKGSSGFEDAHVPMQIKIQDSVAEEVIREGQPLLVKDIESGPQFAHLKRNFQVLRSFMIVPIKRNGEVIGVIHVIDKYPGLGHEDFFDEIDLKVLSAIAREVSVAIENVRFYKELQYLTITDPMTGAHNFRHCTTSLDYEIKRVKRFAGHLGLMMLDIDTFKSYNDQFGHLAGDKVLQEITKIVQSSLRELDILCRYGGDEFVLILPGTDATGTATLAERIRALIENTKFEKQVTVSIGTAQYKLGMTRHELTYRADRALYQAKEEGKNRVCAFG